MLEATLSKAKEHQARIELQHQEEVVRLRRGIEEGQAAAKEAREQAEAHEAAEALARERLKVCEGGETPSNGHVIPKMQNTGFTPPLK